MISDNHAEGKTLSKSNMKYPIYFSQQGGFIHEKNNIESSNTMLEKENINSNAHQENSNSKMKKSNSKNMYKQSNSFSLKSKEQNLINDNQEKFTKNTANQYLKDSDISMKNNEENGKKSYQINLKNTKNHSSRNPADAEIFNNSSFDEANLYNIKMMNDLIKDSASNRGEEGSNYMREEVLNKQTGQNFYTNKGNPTFRIQKNKEMQKKPIHRQNNQLNANTQIKNNSNINIVNIGGKLMDGNNPQTTSYSKYKEKRYGALKDFSSQNFNNDNQKFNDLVKNPTSYGSQPAKMKQNNMVGLNSEKAIEPAKVSNNFNSKYGAQKMLNRVYSTKNYELSENITEKNTIGSCENLNSNEVNNLHGFRRDEPANNDSSRPQDNKEGNQTSKNWNKIYNETNSDYGNFAQCNTTANFNNNRKYTYNEKDSAEDVKDNKYNTFYEKGFRTSKNENQTQNKLKYGQNQDRAGSQPFRYRDFSESIKKNDPNNNSKKSFKRGLTLENNFMINNNKVKVSSKESRGITVDKQQDQTNAQKQDNRNYNKPWLVNTNSVSNKNIVANTAYGNRNFNQQQQQNQEREVPKVYANKEESLRALHSRNNSRRGHDKFDPYQRNLDMVMTNSKGFQKVGFKTTDQNNQPQKDNNGMNIVKSLYKNPSIGSVNPENKSQHHNKSEEVPQTHSKVIDRYEIQKSLGKGSYAVVYQCKDIHNGDLFAIKVYEKSKLYNKTRRTIVEREIQVLGFVNHPNIVRLHKSIQTRNHIHLVMDLGIGASLSGYCKAQKNRCLIEKDARHIFKQLASSLEYCHKNYIYHRDLKTENILVDDSKKQTLLDFGFSIMQKFPSKLNLFCGTPNYMSPEIILKKEYYGGPSDVWALGILLYRITAGYFPFVGKSDKELHKKIVELEFTYSSRASDSLRSLQSKIFCFDPQKRFTVTDIINSPWMQK